MPQPVQSTRSRRRARLILAPAIAVAAVVATATGASAGREAAQPKPAISVNAERSPQGARLTVNGKNWPAGGRIKLTGTRAPGANGTQDFGTADADDKGEIKNYRKVVQCSTSNMDDGQNEQVTITAKDSASGVSATARVQGGAWVCQ